MHGEVINKVLPVAPSGLFPFDLGFKTQVMKIRFTGRDIKGRIFDPIIPFKEALEYFKGHYPDYYHHPKYKLRMTKKTLEHFRLS